MFKVNKNADIIGTSFHNAVVSATYAELVEILGPPLEDDDGYKVSTSWRFSGENGLEPVSLYDWKVTALYDDELPTVKKFRASTVPYEWHVGARSKATAEKFADWLNSLV